MVLAALVIVGFWVVSSVGHDVEPVICPNGDPARIEFDTEVKEPSLREGLEAQRNLPAGKRAVFNEYTGEFQALDAAGEEQRYGDATVPEPLAYACGPSNELVLVPLPEIDPKAAEEAHLQLEHQLRDSAELTGLGGNPARVAR